MMLLDASLRISIVAVAAGLILMVMRVRTSSVRHAVWTVVLMAMLLMPFLLALVPTFEVAVPTAVAVPSAVPALPEPLRPSISSATESFSPSAAAEVSAPPGVPAATVAEFLERSAALRPAARGYLLRDAAAIRAGKMPMSYQYMVLR